MPLDHQMVYPPFGAEPLEDQIGLNYDPQRNPLPSGIAASLLTRGLEKVLRHILELMQRLGCEISSVYG